MQGINIWHKFNLHGAKIVFLLLCFLFTFQNVQAQRLHSQENMAWDTNLPNYDDRLLHYGFTLGLNATRYRPVYAESFFGDTIQSIRSSTAGGFNLGFVSNLRLSKYFDLRLTPGVAFYTRAVQYSFTNGSTSNQSAETVFIETPLLLKYKSQRRKNHRMYMVGGFKTCFEAGLKKKEKKRNELRTNGFDVALDYGFGIDLYFKYFKFAPELRFSHGFINLLHNDPNVYSQSLLKLTSHTVTLYLHFE
jgi:hypothetical protein